MVTVHVLVHEVCIECLFLKADEQERLKNLEEDISDGGSDTDTLQRKLAILTSMSLPGVMSHVVMTTVSSIVTSLTLS